MRKLFVAAALCAVAIVAVAAVSGAAAKGKPKVPGKVSLLLTPSNQAVPPATKASTTNVTATGKLKARQACRAGRTIRFTYITPAGVYDLTRDGQDRFERVVHRDAAEAEGHERLQGQAAEHDHGFGELGSPQPHGQGQRPEGRLS